MFERYTEQARRTLFFARYEASQLGDLTIESEHLLLGLVREGKGLAAHIFGILHVPLEQIRRDIEGRAVSRPKVSTSVEMPFSAETKRILEHAAAEADRLLHYYIGWEHLLLGILHEERSVAGTILTGQGMRLDPVRELVVESRAANPSMRPTDPVSELAAENARLRGVIEDLQARQTLQFRDNAYWVNREEQPADGPYCPTCWDVDRRLVHLLTSPDGTAYCAYCRERPKR